MNRVFCSELSEANGEPLSATASRIDHWVLVEYRGVWARDELEGSLIPEVVKAHLRAQLGTLPRSRLLFVRRPRSGRRDGFAVFYGRTTERDPWFRSLALSAYEELVDVDFATALSGSSHPAGEQLAHPLFVVCTHGKRDPCCARRGRPLYEGLREAADEGWVWQSTHVGGDRFAGNLVCLPEGVYYGRVTRLGALTVFTEHLAGRIDLEHYRGRCSHSFPVQAAELEVRARTGLRELDAVRVGSVTRVGEGVWQVRLEAAATRYEVEVAAEHGELTRLTCAAPGPKRARRFVARSAEGLPGAGA